MLLHYQSYLISKDLFPEDTMRFMFNTISRDDCDDFMNHPDDIELISSTGHMILHADDVHLGKLGVTSRFLRLIIGFIFIYFCEY